MLGDSGFILESHYTKTTSGSYIYYWLASPQDGGSDKTLLFVGSGYMGGNWQSSGQNNKYNSPRGVFRPLVLLDSNYTLEKTKDIDGNDAFKIVEK